MCERSMLMPVMKYIVLMLVGGSTAGTDGFHLSCVGLTWGGLREGLWGTPWTFKPIWDFYAVYIYPDGNPFTFYIATQG